MDPNQFTAAINKAACRLGSYWEAKIVVGGMLATAEFHLQLMSLFVALIVIDLATKVRGEIGLSAGTVKSAGLPNITGYTGPLRFMSGITNDSFEGALYLSGGPTGPAASMDGQNPGNQIKINASRSSSIYGNSSTVQPPALTMRYIIKY